MLVERYRAGSAIFGRVWPRLLGHTSTQSLRKYQQNFFIKNPTAFFSLNQKKTAIKGRRMETAISGPLGTLTFPLARGKKAKKGSVDDLDKSGQS